MHWTRHHSALLNALRGSDVIPVLFRRLSRERFVATEADVRRLRDWPGALMRDQGWSALEPHLHRPEAWPQVWHDACARGFSPRSDHHHALLFDELVERFLRAADFEGALYAWTECMRAWARVFTTDYPRHLVDDVRPNLGEDEVQEVVRNLFDGYLQRRRRDLEEALGLHAEIAAPQIERRRLRFAWAALDAVEETMGRLTSRDAFGALETLLEGARLVRNEISARVVARFERFVDAIDFSSAEGDELLDPFRWAASVFRALGLDTSETAVTAVVSKVVDACWTLRKVGRDDRPEFGQLVELATPFNDNLLERLRTFSSAFGHNARCADFLVFQGEQAKDHARRKELFRTGLEICPGHRNSAMLLSYEYLQDVNVILLQTSASPALLALLPGPGDRVGARVREAWALCDLVEETYAFNKELDDYRARVQAEAERLGVPLEET